MWAKYSRICEGSIEIYIQQKPYNVNSRVLVNGSSICLGRLNIQFGSAMLMMDCLLSFWQFSSHRYDDTMQNLQLFYSEDRNEISQQRHSICYTERVFPGY